MEEDMEEEKKFIKSNAKAWKRKMDFLLRSRCSFIKNWPSWTSFLCYTLKKKSWASFFFAREGWWKCGDEIECENVNEIILSLNYNIKVSSGRKSRLIKEKKTEKEKNEEGKKLSSAMEGDGGDGREKKVCHKSHDEMR